MEAAAYESPAAPAAELQRNNHRRDHSWNFVTNNPPLPPILAPSSTNNHTQHQEHELVDGICIQCRNALTSAFEHCLSRRTGLAESESVIPTIESIHQIDEVADATQLQPPPYFEVVPDPTLKTNKPPLWEDPATKVARERYAWLEARKDAEREDPSNMYIGNGSMPMFSGILYKRQLAARDREIRMLREKLFDKDRAERYERDNADKLRHALGKSMRFYVYAEEWQQQESSRLQRDVRLLKAEISSLMAFLVSAEEERRKVLAQMEELQQVIHSKDGRIREVELARDDFKVRLHASFKETLAMNESIVKLQELVDRGGEVVAKRNELLQQGLERMSQDYEKAQSEAIECKTRVRDLEFELAEMQRQFDRMGNARTGADRECDRLNAECIKASAEMKKLKSDLDSSTSLNVKLDRELTLMTQLQATTKTSLTSQIEDLTTSLDVMTKARQTLDTEATQLRAECKKLKQNLDHVTRAKETLERTSGEDIGRLAADVSSRDSTIRELQFKSAEDSRVLRQLKDKNESLMSQCTDLMNGLEHETAEVKSLKFDVNKGRRAADEQRLKLEDRIDEMKKKMEEMAANIEALEHNKVDMQAELDRRAETIVELENEYARFKAECEDTITALKKELLMSTQAHMALQQQHNSLLEAHYGLNDTESHLRADHAATTAELAARNQECADLKQTLADLESQHAKLNDLHAGLQREQEDMRRHLDSIQIKCRELSAHLGNVEKESASTIREKEALIFNLTKDLHHARTEGRQAIDQFEPHRIEMDRVKASLEVARVDLKSEIHGRQRCEAKLQQLRLECEYEKTKRESLESTLCVVGYQSEVRQADRISICRARDHSFDEASRLLKQQLERLMQTEELMPLVMKGERHGGWRPEDEDDIVSSPAVTIATFVAPDFDEEFPHARRQVGNLSFVSNSASVDKSQRSSRIVKK
ncbi:hypothetical protein SmJEL517_g02014 [Synchytrium microbalum]|uniref:Uncharacterized protein n=1 Tax=Synchytrium microbalum TaxID=1806994 RepID=A0A507C8M8_9FUNG|nr:uncharacterized protein SmJEL517_g02014 [Synchytrium microbalum]TPX35688.1 hypothetical protein SmJEL517_g02014 [Synchytrium microbalum]